MAEELRWETLFSTAVADTSAFGEFRNETSGDINIRSLDGDFMLTVAVSSDSIVAGGLQISKSRIRDVTNNSSIFQANISLHCSKDATDGNGAGGDSGRLNKLYAKGQLTLEPGESLFAHLDFTNTPGEARSTWTIGYHFD